MDSHALQPIADHILTFFRTTGTNEGLVPFFLLLYRNSKKFNFPSFLFVFVVQLSTTYSRHTSSFGPSDIQRGIYQTLES